MPTYLVLNKDGTTKSYKCKETHTGQPYLKVSNSYLDLTTNTTTGLRLEVTKNGQTYIPVQTVTTTASRSSEYTETTAYSGVSSSQYTANYSLFLGVSGTQYFSSYNLNTKTNQAAHTCTGTVTKMSTRTYGYPWSSTTFKKNMYKLSNGTFTATQSTSSNYRILVTYKNNTVSVLAVSLPEHLKYLVNHPTDPDKIGHVSSDMSKIWVETSAESTNSATTYGVTVNTSQSDYYTSSTDVAHMSSTTALTVTSSRSSTYETITEG